MSSRASRRLERLAHRCTRRSLLVTVPSVSHHAAEAGSTTSASCAVRVRKMSCTTRWSRPSSSWTACGDVGLRLGRVLADHVERPRSPCSIASNICGQVPSVARRDREPQAAGSNLAARSSSRMSWNPGSLFGDGAHVAAALHVVLPAQRVEAAAVAADVAGEQRQVDEREHVVDRVVVLGDAERPAQLGPVGRA